MNLGPIVGSLHTSPITGGESLGVAEKYNHLRVGVTETQLTSLLPPMDDNERSKGSSSLATSNGF